MVNYLYSLLLAAASLVAIAQPAPTERGGKVEAGKMPTSSQTAYGVVIGISAYEHLPKLQFADRDARVFANYLVRAAHVPATQVEVLVNQQATLVNVTDALTAVRRQVKSGDRVYVYFAGHGDIETRTDSTENAMLMLVGAASKDYNATFDKCYLRDLKRWLDDLATAGAEVVFVADACRSGAFVLAGGALGQNRTLLGLEQQWAGQVKMLACEPGELAIEGAEFGGGRGLFSYCLVDGLMGMADGAGDNERDGMVTKGELEAYLKAVVRKTARPHVQNPQVLGGESGLSLGKVNLDSLRTYQQRKTRDFALLTATQTKGLNTDLLRTYDSTTQRVYELFDRSLSARHLLYPANTSALYYLRQLPLKGNAKLLGLMKRNLVAALQQRTDELLRPLLRVIQEHDVPTPVAKLDSAIVELDSSMALLGRDHNLIPNLTARRLFLEGSRLLKTERTLVNTNDSLSLIALARFRQSAKLEPNMVYTYWMMAEASFVLLQVDSTVKHLEKCRELLPNSIAVLHRLGSHYMLRHQNQKAQQAFDDALRIDPANPDANSKLADFYYKTGNVANAQTYTKRALTAIDKLYTRAAERSLLLYEKGSVMADAGQYDKAILCLGESLAIDSTNGDAMLTLGRSYGHQKKWKLAIGVYERMVKRYPDFSVAYSALADACIKLYDQTHEPDLARKAQIHINESLSRNPGNILALFSQSVLLFSQEKYVAALPYVQKAIIGNPSIPEAHFMLGAIYAMRGDTLLGRKSLERADSLGYTNHETKQIWGFLAEARKDFSAAEQYYRQGLALKPTSVNNMAGLARSLLNQQQRLDEALSVYQRLQRLEPRTESYWTSAGYIYNYQKKYPEALAMFNESARLNPKKAYNWLLIGQVHRAAGQYQQAADTFAKAYLLDSTNADYAIRAARIYAYTLKQPDHAYPLVKRVITIDSALAQPTKNEKKRLAEAYSILGSICYSQSQYADGINWFKKATATELDGRFNDYYFQQVGFGYFSLRQFPDAITNLREAIMLKPTDGNYRVMLATAYLMNGAPTEAEAEARRAIRTDSTNARATSILAVALIRQNRYDDAWQVIQCLEKIAPASAWEVPYAYARWYARQGKVADALHYLDATLKCKDAPDRNDIQTNPDFDPIRQEVGFNRLLDTYFPGTKQH